MGTKPQQKAKPIEQKTNRVVEKKIEKKVYVATPIAKASGDVYYYASEIIRRHEGFNHNAYPDHTRRSIGYGTISYAGEVITYEEGFRRFKSALEKRVARVQKDHPTFNAYQQGALVSLLYNCPSCYNRTLNGVGRGDFTRVALIGTKYERGLHKRAENEYALFSLGVIY